MEVGERDSIREWLLPEEARPPTIAQMVERIEEALATARASEAAVMTVGAAALDAAEQARRAAELAERASRAAFAPPVIAAPVGPATRAPTGGGDGELSDFHARADFVAARLRELQRVPLGGEANVESPR